MVYLFPDGDSMFHNVFVTLFFSMFVPFCDTFICTYPLDVFADSIENEHLNATLDPHCIRLVTVRYTNLGYFNYENNG